MAYTDLKQINRQRALSQQLRGQDFNRNSTLSGLAHVLRQYGAGRGEFLAGQKETQNNELKQSELASLLRGAQTGEPVDYSSYEHPDSQNLALQLALKDPKDTFKTLTDEEEAAMGLDTSGTYQQGSDGSIKPISSPSKPSAAVEGYNMAKAQGYTGTFMDYQTALKRAGKTDITNNLGGATGPKVGSLSNDYTYVTGPDGQPVFDENGLPRAAAVPGSKEHKRLQEEAAAAAKQQDVKTVSGAEKADTILSSVGKIRSLIEGSDMPVVGTASVPFALYSGTAAGKVRSLVGPLKSGIAMNAMMRLKEASSSGATGFGALNKEELNILISELGALDPDNTDKSIILDTLGRIEGMYTRVANDIQKNVSPEKIEELGLTPIIEQFASGGKSAGDTSEDVPEGIDPEDWKYYSAEQKALFQVKN